MTLENIIYYLLMQLEKVNLSFKTWKKDQEILSALKKPFQVWPNRESQIQTQVDQLYTLYF